MVRLKRPLPEDFMRKTTHTSAVKKLPRKLAYKGSVSTLKKKLWKHFADYVKARDKYTCFTCGRKAEGAGLHAGHFIAKSVGGITLYFSEKNVHAQCYNCNINLSGNQWVYGKRLGEDVVNELLVLKNAIVKWTIDDYLRRIEEYKKKLEELTASRADI